MLADPAGRRGHDEEGEQAQREPPHRPADGDGEYAPDCHRSSGDSPPRSADWCYAEAAELAAAWWPARPPHPMAESDQDEQAGGSAIAGRSE